MTFWIDVGKTIVGGVVFISLVGLFVLVVGFVVHILNKLDGF